MFSPYLSLLSIPGARAFVGWGMLARVHMGLTGLATFMLVQIEYGSYATAGLVLAMIAISYAVVSPIVARLVDAFGQSQVLRWGFGIAIAGRVAMVVAALTTQPWWVLLAIAPFFAAGGSQSTLTRARWTHVVKTRAQLNSAFSLESSLEGALYIAGPIIATVLAAQLASWVPSAIAIVTLAVGGYKFLSLKDTEPPVQRRSVDAGVTEAALGVSPTTSTGAIALPPVTAASVRRMRRYRNPFAGHLLVTTPTLALAAVIFMSQGMIFASIDASTVAFATESGMGAFAGVVLAFWSLGSLVGGMYYGSKSWATSLATRLLLCVTWVGAGVTTFVFAPSLVVLAGVMFLTGLALAPTMVTGDSLVHAAVSRAHMTEGMTWTRTGVDVGVAVGAWLAGSRIDAHGSQGGFAVAGGAAIAGMILVACAWSYIRRQPRLDELAEAEPGMPEPSAPARHPRLRPVRHSRLRPAGHRSHVGPGRVPIRLPRIRHRSATMDA